MWFKLSKFRTQDSDQMTDIYSHISEHAEHTKAKKHFPAQLEIEEVLCY